MRLLFRLVPALLVLATLAGCGTKTPLTLPPQTSASGAVAPPPTPLPAEPQR